MTSTIEKLDSEVKIPYDEEALLSKDPVRIAEYILELVRTLQELLEDITTVANYGVDLTDGEALYIGLKDSDGEYPNGTWRFIRNGDNLERQVKIDGTFAFAGDFERPI